MVAAFLIEKQFSRKWVQAIFIVQMTVVFLILVVCRINAWSFPIQQAWVVIIVLILLLALVFYFIKSKQYTTVQKTVLIPASAMIFTFFLLNANFYPQLLKYQGGNELAFATRNKVDPSRIYFWKETYSSSFNFYSQTIRKPFADSVLLPGTTAWIVYDIKDTADIRNSGI